MSTVKDGGTWSEKLASDSEAAVSSILRPTVPLMLDLPWRSVYIWSCCCCCCPGQGREAPRWG